LEEVAEKFIELIESAPAADAALDFAAITV
jgi:hypothetical protein